MASTDRLRPVGSQHPVAKSITYCALATWTTILMGGLMSGEWANAGVVATAKTALRVPTFWLHNKLWDRVDRRLGFGDRQRAAARAVSWRVVGTLETLLISWAVTGSFWRGVSWSIGEAVVKLGLTYQHERVWQHLDRQMSTDERARPPSWPPENPAGLGPGPQTEK